MPHLQMSWQAASLLAGCLLLWAAAARMWRSSPHWLGRTTPFAREAGLVVALYALWQYAGSFTVMGPQGAIARGRWIWDTERRLRMPSETALQHLVLPHPVIVQICNLYYASMHFAGLIIFLVWLFGRHRDQYPRWRANLVMVTAACLLVQLVPVAPPRMLAGTGMVDTAVRYGQSVYTAFGSAAADQLSAMPSVHVAWAVLVAIAVWQATRSRWRWLAVAHAVLTVLIVAATANHYWLDGIVAAALLLGAMGVQSGVSALATARRGTGGLAVAGASGVATAIAAGARPAPAAQPPAALAVMLGDADETGDTRTTAGAEPGNRQ